MASPVWLPPENRRWSAKLLEAVLFCLLSAFLVLYWLGHLALNQDSTTYIAVARNISSTGRLNYYVNYTNFVNPPKLNNYLDQPPGFPYLLVPFIAVLHDPLISAAAAQSLYLILFLVSIYLIARKLKLSPLLRVVALILFTFSTPLVVVYRHFWTETPFLALSVAAGAIAIDLVNGGNRKRDWILYCLLVAASTMIRYIGVANLAFIASLILRWDTLRAAWRVLTHRYTLIAVSVAGGVFIALSLLSETLPGAKPGMGPMQVGGLWIGAAGLFASAALFLVKTRLPGSRASADQAYPPLTSQAEPSVWPFIALVTTAAPLIAWFARNRILFGRVTAANQPFEAINSARILDPLTFIWTDLLTGPIILRLVLAGFIILLLLGPFYWKSILGMAGFRKRAHVALICGMLGHFLLIWALRVFVTISPIRERFFAPVLAFLLLAIINAFQQASQSVRLVRWRPAVQALPLVFLTLGGLFSPADFLNSAGKVNYPPERQLWNEINRLEWTHSSSYFYSDYGYEADGYIHQIFSDIPEGLLWDPGAVRNSKVIKHILSDGVNPFILVIENGPDVKILDEMSASSTLSLQKIAFPDAGFVLYRLAQ